MAAVSVNCVSYLGKDFVAQVAEQQLIEMELPATVRARCLAAFTDPALERDATRLRLYLLAAVGDRKIAWPRLDYWKNLFDKLGGERPHTWTQGIFPTERRKAHLPKSPALALKTDAIVPGRIITPAQDRRRSAAIKLEERHHAALLGLLQHYVQFVCYAERDRRQIANLGAEPCLILSGDAVENKIEKMWLDGAVLSQKMWRAEPPLFPGHRATLKPRPAPAAGVAAARKSAKQNVWVVTL